MDLYTIANGRRVLIDQVGWGTRSSSTYCRIAVNTEKNETSNPALYALYLQWLQSNSQSSATMGIHGVCLYCQLDCNGCVCHSLYWRLQPAGGLTTPIYFAFRAALWAAKNACKSAFKCTRDAQITIEVAQLMEYIIQGVIARVAATEPVTEATAHTQTAVLSATTPVVAAGTAKRAAAVSVTALATTGATAIHLGSTNNSPISHAAVDALMSLQALPDAAGAIDDDECIGITEIACNSDHEIRPVVTAD